ncbi:dehydrogenase/reductase SDR family member 1-like [Acanthaster planci]|uniref:Dehydrogenase/reductase SDR family member 1-like n=1 Tax=Acanthaster planci TaxID=133434 RepID=A0A8B7Z5N0_ACAPL|nr:dehydrogenase/reductase SDR family member 1-like [Acanthaster planci]
MASSLKGKVCLVTGASRGIGRGIALQLGEAGATVYITGRTLKPKTDGTPGTQGSLSDTAIEIEARGGKCIPVQCDHSDDEQVEKVFHRIASDQDGRLDLLVNNAYAGVKDILETTGKPFWEVPSSVWDSVNNVGLRGHYIATWHAAKMMAPAKQGLIVNISSAGGLSYLFNVAYGVGKAGCDRMAVDCAVELRKHNVACISLWPGPVKTEMFQEFMTTDGFTGLDKGIQFAFQEGESVEFAGKAIVHLLQDENIMKKSGRIHMTGELADEYGFRDINGASPMNFRRVKTLFQLTGHPWLAAAMPSFLKVPYWMMTLGNSKF